MQVTAIHCQNGSTDDCVRRPISTSMALGQGEPERRVETTSLSALADFLASLSLAWPAQPLVRGMNEANAW